MGTDLVFDALVLATENRRTHPNDRPDRRGDHTAGRCTEQTDGRRLDAGTGHQSLVGDVRDRSMHNGRIAGVNWVACRVCGSVYLWVVGLGGVATMVYIKHGCVKGIFESL